MAQQRRRDGLVAAALCELHRHQRRHPASRTSLNDHFRQQVVNVALDCRLQQGLHDFRVDGVLDVRIAVIPRRRRAIARQEGPRTVRLPLHDRAFRKNDAHIDVASVVREWAGEDGIARGGRKRVEDSDGVCRAAARREGADLTRSVGGCRLCVALAPGYAKLPFSAVHPHRTERLRERVVGQLRQHFVQRSFARRPEKRIRDDQHRRPHTGSASHRRHLRGRQLAHQRKQTRRHVFIGTPGAGCVIRQNVHIARRLAYRFLEESLDGGIATAPADPPQTCFDERRGRCRRNRQRLRHPGDDGRRVSGSEHRPADRFFRRLGRDAVHETEVEPARGLSPGVFDGAPERRVVGKRRRRKACQKGCDQKPAAHRGTS